MLYLGLGFRVMLMALYAFEVFCAQWSMIFPQMYAMPVFDMIEDLSRRKGIKSRFFTRVVMRTVFVVFTAFVGITLPFFGGRSNLI